MFCVRGLWQWGQAIHGAIDCTFPGTSVARLGNTCICECGVSCARGRSTVVVEVLHMGVITVLGKLATDWQLGGFIISSLEVWFVIV